MLLLAALVGPAAHAASVVQIQVASDWRPVGVRFDADTQWLGEARSLRLQDDGRAPDQRAGDGVWTGEWRGDEVRALSLRLRATVGSDEPVELWAGTETLTLGEQRLAFAVQERGTGAVAHRSALALPLPAMEVAEASSVAALLGWAGLVLLYAMWLVGRAARAARS